jgi:hypothetical protein
VKSLRRLFYILLTEEKEGYMKTASLTACIGITAVALLAGGISQAFAAPSSLTIFSDYQTYVVSGADAPSNTLGTTYADTSFYLKGAMMISAPMDDLTPQGYKNTRTMDALFSFNTATAATGYSTQYVTNPVTGIDIKSAFNTKYGAGNWSIKSASMTLNSNWYVEGVQPNNPDFNKVASGLFTLYVLGGNPDITTTTWNTLQSYLPTTTSTSLGTFQWTAQPVGTTDNTGTEPAVTYNLILTNSLINAMLSGELTVHGVAADNKVGYVFNTNNRISPQLTITADVNPPPAAVPAMTPAVACLCAAALAGMSFFRSRTMA